MTQVATQGLDAQRTPVDAVEDSIRQWHDTKRQAQEAINRANRLSEDCARLQGQNDLLMSQKAADDVEIAQLHERLREQTNLINSVRELILPFGGSRRVTSFAPPAMRPAPPNTREVEDALSELGAVALGSLHGANNPRPVARNGRS